MWIGWKQRQRMRRSPFRRQSFRRASREPAMSGLVACSGPGEEAKAKKRLAGEVLWGR